MEEVFPDSGQGDIEDVLDDIIRERSGHQTVCDRGVAKPLNHPEKLSFVRANELEKMELEPPLFIVRNMIPTGLTIIAGPPKFGKSWFVLDMCLSVAQGKEFLGNETHQCSVLYLALEDSKNRLKSRITNIMDGKRSPKGLMICNNAVDLEHGLVEQLEQFVEHNSDVKLIVIDTFQKIRSDMRRGENAYSADYREAGMLKTFADSYKIALVLVHHTRKTKDFTDAFANVSGTSGLTGASDTMLVFDKEKRSSKETKLSITGRDVEMQELEIAFDHYRFHVLGTAEEIEEKRVLEDYLTNPLVLTIQSLLESNKGTWTGTASEIIEMSRSFDSPIFMDAVHVGKEIGKISEILYKHDGIIWKTINNGTGAKKHRFYYENNPFKDDS